MKLSPSKINAFLLFKLPSAYFVGVRVKSISETTCITTVKHRWINQNPFQSMFWAVQGMAAELSTGALVMAKIKEQNKAISILVANNRGTFNKKARGRITFICSDVDSCFFSGSGDFSLADVLIFFFFSKKIIILRW